MEDKIISLNVGGQVMCSSRSTLTKVKGSLLELMFDPDHSVPPSKLIDGAYFIDEDPEVFRAILTWLRRGVLEASATVMQTMLRKKGTN
jgi:hypothetical protein